MVDPMDQSLPAHQDLSINTSTIHMVPLLTKLQPTHLNSSLPTYPNNRIFLNKKHAINRNQHEREALSDSNRKRKKEREKKS